LKKDPEAACKAMNYFNTTGILPLVPLRENLGHGNEYLLKKRSLLSFQDVFDKGT
jgi:hypothetical protein